MKTAVFALFLSAISLSSPALAGSLADPVVSEPVIVEDAGSSSSGTTFVLLMALVLSIPVMN